jgi:hypothetical protein
LRLLFTVITLPKVDDFPEKIRNFVKIKNLYKQNDTYYCVPLGHNMTDIGAVIGLGNTLEEAIKQATDNAKQIEGYMINIKTGSIDEAQKIIADAENIGIKF